MVIGVKINQKVVFSFNCILLYIFDLIKYTYNLIGNSTYNYLLQIYLELFYKDYYGLLIFNNRIHIDLIDK